jgi:hypothetical protein
MVALSRHGGARSRASSCCRHYRFSRHLRCILQDRHIPRGCPARSFLAGLPPTNVIDRVAPTDKSRYRMRYVHGRTSDTPEEGAEDASNEAVDGRCRRFARSLSGHRRWRLARREMQQTRSLPGARLERRISRSPFVSPALLRRAHGMRLGNRVRIGAVRNCNSVTSAGKSARVLRRTDAGHGSPAEQSNLGSSGAGDSLFSPSRCPTPSGLAGVRRQSCTADGDCCPHAQVHGGAAGLQRRGASQLLPGGLCPLRHASVRGRSSAVTCGAPEARLLMVTYSDTPTRSDMADLRSRASSWHPFVYGLPDRTAVELPVDVP